MENKNLPILHSQYCGCWCPGDARGQGISSHCIDLVFLEYSSLRIKRVNPYCDLFVALMECWINICYDENLFVIPGLEKHITDAIVHSSNVETKCQNPLLLQLKNFFCANTCNILYQHVFDVDWWYSYDELYSKACLVFLIEWIFGVMLIRSNCSDMFNMNMDLVQLCAVMTSN